MSKKFKFETLKRCAGRFNFDPGKTLELTEDEAKELLADDAVRPTDPTMPDSFYPTGKAPKPTAKKTAAAGKKQGDGATDDGDAS